MGRHWGQLAKVSGIITYSLSPFEQKAFAGMVSKGVPNTIRRIYESMFRVAPPMVLGYLIYDWGEKEHTRLARKDPKEFENDS